MFVIGYEMRNVNYEGIGVEEIYNQSMAINLLTFSHK